MTRCISSTLPLAREKVPSYEKWLLASLIKGQGHDWQG
jgi:hypothetical protein